MKLEICNFNFLGRTAIQTQKVHQRIQIRNVSRPLSFEKKMETYDAAVIAVVLILIAAIAIAALIVALDDDTTNNFFFFRRATGFYSMYGATNVSPSTADTPVSILGGNSNGSNQIPANFLHAGSSFWIRADGALTTANNQTVRIFTNIAPNVFVDVGAFAPSAEPYPWSLLINCTVVDSNNINVTITVFTTLASLPTWTNTGSAGFNTRDKQTIDVDVQFAVADTTAERWTTLSLQEGLLIR
jgi:hypothetical protein